MTMRAARRPARDWMSLGWLLFLAYPVAGFVLQPRSLADGLWFWGVLLAFVALYVASQWRRGGDDAAWALAGYAGGLLAFAGLFPLLGAAASSFLIYGSFLVGNQPHRARALGLSVLSALLLLGLMFWYFPRWGAQPWAWAVPTGWALMTAYMLFSTYGMHLGWRAREAGRQLRLAQAEKERLAADAERERIARDLHDLLGHTLSVIVLKSELAGKLAGRDPARAAQEIREVERIGREALTEVRAAVHGYRGSGLSAELARAKVALDAAGVRLSVTGPLPDLPAPTEASAAMLLREAVTNVVRHAHAREVEVSLTRTAKGHRLVIRDDGVGGSGPEGSGLTGMRERLRGLGGHLTRDGTRGTTLTADLPLEPGGEAAGPGMVTA